MLDREIARQAKEGAVARRLMTIPGIGAVTAAALTALTPPAHTFRRGRDFAAWLGLTPVQRSSGGRSGSAGHPRWGSAPATLADHRRQRGGTLGRAQGRYGWLVAGAHARPQAAPAGAGGAGQQDGPHRLGAAGQGWGLSSSGCGGVGVATTARLSRSGKVRGRVWRYSRETGRENQCATPYHEYAALIGPDPRTPIRARGMRRAASEAEHMSAPDDALHPARRFFLLPKGRPHMLHGSGVGAQ